MNKISHKYEIKQFRLKVHKRRVFSCTHAFYYDTMLFSFSRLGGGL